MLSSSWIFTNKKMPNYDEPVLVWLYEDYYIGVLSKDTDTLIDFWRFGDFNLYGEEMEHVIAWMPLPNPPII